MTSNNEEEIFCKKYYEDAHYFVRSSANLFYEFIVLPVANQWASYRGKEAKVVEEECLEICWWWCSSCSLLLLLISFLLVPPRLLTIAIGSHLVDTIGSIQQFTIFWSFSSLVFVSYSCRWNSKAIESNLTFLVLVLLDRFVTRSIQEPRHRQAEKDFKNQSSYSSTFSTRCKTVTTNFII